MQFDLKYRIIFNRQLSINHTKTVICLRFRFFFHLVEYIFCVAFFISPAHSSSTYLLIAGKYIFADISAGISAKFDILSLEGEATMTT